MGKVQHDVWGSAESPVSSLQTSIDSEIADNCAVIRHYQELNRALRTRRNTLLRICSLPPEVLARIFSKCNERHRVLASHVCRHWREVALSEPRLWSTLSLNVSSNTVWEQVKFTRSRHAPLDLSVVMVDRNREGRVQRLQDLREPLGQIPRTYKLDVHYDQDSAPLLYESLTAPVNNLRDLRLHYHIRDAGHRDIVFMPDTILPEGTPALRLLSLHSCAFQWSSPIFVGLSHLALTNIPIHLRATPEQLLSVAQRSPGLKTLKVDLGLGGVEDAPSSWVTSSTIKLSRLQSFDLAAPFNEYAGFLSHVELPASASLKLEVGVFGMTPTDTSMSLVPGKFFSPREGAPRQVLQLEEWANRQFSVRLYDLDEAEEWGSFHVHSSDARHRVNATFMCSSDRKTALREHVASTMANSCLQVVHTLKVHTRYLSADLPWTTLLLNASQTQRLFVHLEKANMPEFLLAIDPRQWEGGSPPLPHLAELHIRRNGTEDWQDNVTLANVIDIVTSRKKAGMGLARLILENWYTGSDVPVDEILESMRTVVADVQWRRRD
ncbi:hypothetical protein CONPUDRAFT_167108 [Coniophora puteana RWD-64-598 SS2]|uniref:F-box domain-containing protein n=1 Tax=Coniophora puteana (strain RWD-64-598) TaxID=741705 RepID=A0A5M3MLA2_CONPW|nr:uncharacterized protein CONPUDRAFT_167108 [Coniophora puteana RWD-64-598 SS2]EIW79351.1 hypothetical protein CONPUDRAFT_167108 [Coniophora puteana RWD-64-598 SS2]